MARVFNPLPNLAPPVAAGDVVRYYDPSNISASDLAGAFLEAFSLEVCQAGSVRVSFDHFVVGTGDAVFCRIKLNGVVQETWSQSTIGTFARSRDVAIAVGDVISVEVARSTDRTSSVDDFRVSTSGQHIVPCVDKYIY